MKYWSCSKFADGLRGTNIIDAGTSQQWDAWHATAKAAHPMRYWLAETGLDIVQDTVMYVPKLLRSCMFYINNRFITATHALVSSPAHIKPGHWCDLSHRILPCIMQAMQDFVEVELAAMEISCNPDCRQQYAVPALAMRWLSPRCWRSPTAGLANLQWQATLSDPACARQSHAARELIEIYHWWTVTRPARPDPETLDLPMEQHLNMEQDQWQQDTDYLTRLMVIRHELWT